MQNRKDREKILINKDGKNLIMVYDHLPKTLKKDDILFSIDRPKAYLFYKYTVSLTDELIALSDYNLIQFDEIKCFGDRCIQISEDFAFTPKIETLIDIYLKRV